MARLNLSFTHDGSIDITHPRTGWEAVKRIARYLWGIGNGANTNSSVVAQDGVSAASGTLTLVSVAAGTIVRVNNVPFTAVSSGATGDQFNVGGTDSADATSLAAAITASSTAGVSGVVTASASDNVVTVTAQDSGLHGNAVTLSVDGAEATGTITLAAVTAGTVVRVNGTAFTAVSGAAGANEFDIDGTDAQDATALAAAITAAIPTIATAAAADEVVTVTAATEGVAGNTVTLEVDDVAASGTLTLASVTAGTVVRINGVPFTAVNGSPVVANGEFDISGSDDDAATSLAAALNGSSHAAISGVVTAAANTAVVTVTAVAAGPGGNAVTLETDGVVASGTVTYSSATGTLTTTINGVGVTAAAGASDTLSATAMAAAINASANALVAGHVRSTSNAAVVTLYAIKPGVEGNAITLTAAADGGTATASGARLTGGVVDQGEGVQASGTVTITGADGGAYSVAINGVTINATGVNGDDGATADAIAAAIQQDGVGSALVVQHVYAESDGVSMVTVTAQRGGTGGNAITLAATGTGAVASGARLTGGAAATAVVPSAARLASGSTPATVTLSGARLTGGAANATVTLSGARLTGGAVTTEKTYAL